MGSRAAQCRVGEAAVRINTWTFIVVNVAMVVSLGKLYGKFVSNEEAGKLIMHILLSVGWLWGVRTLGIKFLAELLKGPGVVTLGGATVAGMALDAALSGGLTHALGFTTKTYIKEAGEISEEAIRRGFMLKFQQGKEKIKNR